jgi:hypothetical protein
MGMTVMGLIDDGSWKNRIFGLISGEFRGLALTKFQKKYMGGQ